MNPLKITEPINSTELEEFQEEVNRMIKSQCFTDSNKKPLTTPLTFYRNWLNINLINSLSRCESQLNFQKNFKNKKECFGQENDI